MTKKLADISETQRSIVYQNILNKLTRHGRNKTKEEALSLATVSSLLIELMEFVEKFSLLSGFQKKEAVKTAISVLVDESNITGELEPIVLRMIPVLIDNFIKIKDGQKLRINRSPFRKLKHLMSCCFPKNEDKSVPLPPLPATPR